MLDNDHHYLFADASGSLVVMDGALFAAQRINQAFALVSTAGVANIPVNYENISVGTTDESGHLLVTNLLPWQKNHLGIQTVGLAANMEVERVEAMAVPRALRRARRISD